MSPSDARQFGLLVFVLCLGILGPLSVCGSPPDTVWTQAYGGVDVDVGAVVRSMLDGGYLITGWTYSFGSGGSDLYLIKTDSVGNEQWVRVYGGLLNDGGDVCVMTPDSCYLIAGLTYSFGAGGSDVWLVKVDPAGDTVYTRVYGGPYDEAVSSLQRISDGNYIIAGRTYDPASENDIYLLKIDENGDTLWTRSFVRNGDEYCYSALETSDHGFIVCGRVKSFGAIEYDVFLGKADSTGDLLWLRTYGGHLNDYGYSVQHAPNGGYLIAGHTLSFGAGSWDVYLIRTDSVGDTLWTRTYGGPQPDEAFSIDKLQDEFVIAGASYSYGAGLSDMYVLRISDSGDTLWTTTYGGIDEDWAYNVIQTPDSAFVIVGYSESFGPGYVDVYLVKTEPDVAVSEKEERRQGNRVRIMASPNPFTSGTSVTLRGTSLERPVQINMYDVCGRLVLSRSLVAGTSYLGTDLSPGLYYLSIEGLPPQKLIKVK